MCFAGTSAACGGWWRSRVWHGQALAGIAVNHCEERLSLHYTA